MTNADVQIVIERARERFPEAHPRIISDNGKQFTAKELKEYLRFAGMTQVRTSPYYPQSNGKLERWNGTFKRECIRPKVPTSKDDAIRIAGTYIDYYNTERLHSAIRYISPRDKLLGNAEAIKNERNQKLKTALNRRVAFHASEDVKEQDEKCLTQITENSVSV
jgi:transposase InsO family protein